MRNRGVVKTAEDFDQWVAEQQAGSPVAAAVAEVNPDWATNSPINEVVTPDGLAGMLDGADATQVSQGWASFQNNCAACHQIRTDGVTSGADFSANTGPNLTHLMSRKEFAGAIFDLYLLENPDDPNGGWTDEPNVEQLTAWVYNAPGLKAMRPADGVGMPSFNTLPQAEIDALVAYLLTME